MEEFSTSGFVGILTADGKREVWVPDTNNAVPSVPAIPYLLWPSIMGGRCTAKR